jgi:hypothetical protein
LLLLKVPVEATDAAEARTSNERIESDGTRRNDENKEIDLARPGEF